MELVYPNEVFSEKYNVVLYIINILFSYAKYFTILSIGIIIKRYIHTKICMILKTPLLFQVFFQPLSDCPPTEAAATSQVQS